MLHDRVIKLVQPWQELYSMICCAGLRINDGKTDGHTQLAVWSRMYGWLVYWLIEIYQSCTESLRKKPRLHADCPVEAAVAAEPA